MLDWRTHEERLVRLSMWHITPEDASILFDASEGDVYEMTVSRIPNVGYLVGCKYGKPIADGGRLVVGEQFSKLLDSLSNNCVTWLLLDREAPMHPDLPAYDWYSEDW